MNNKKKRIIHSLSWVFWFQNQKMVSKRDCHCVCEAGGSAREELKK